MIFWPIEKLVAAGITTIMIVTGTEHAGGMINALGSGAEFGANFLYAVQDQAGGIAQALALVKPAVQNEKICVVLGDNMFEQPLDTFVKNYATQKCGSRIVLADIQDTELTRFGVAFTDNENRILSMIEKPSTQILQDKTKNNNCTAHAITGIYFYDSTVFDIIKDLKPSNRGELEITDVHNAYMQANTLEYDTLHGWWSDSGSFDSLTRVQALLAG